MGQIKVTIQEAKRLAAITMLSETVLYIAKALSAVPQVTITNCHVVSSDIGISVDTALDVMKTTVHDVEDDIRTDTGLTNPTE